MISLVVVAGRPLPAFDVDISIQNKSGAGIGTTGVVVGESELSGTFETLCKPQIPAQPPGRSLVIDMGTRRLQTDDAYMIVDKIKTDVDVGDRYTRRYFVDFRTLTWSVIPR